MTDGASTQLAALGRRLRCVGRRMQGSVEARIDALDISYTQWNALRSIEGRGGCGTCTLAEDLSITAASMSRIVAGLEARGLVSRETACATRQARLSLTPAGRAILREAAPIIAERMADAFADLSPAEIARFTRLLSKLAGSIEHRA